MAAADVVAAVRAAKCTSCPTIKERSCPILQLNPSASYPLQPSNSNRVCLDTVACHQAGGATLLAKTPVLEQISPRVAHVPGHPVPSVNFWHIQARPQLTKPLGLALARWFARTGSVANVTRPAVHVVAFVTDPT
jgi:hypothetical protein